jgi:hypothetical protein
LNSFVDPAGVFFREIQAPGGVPPDFSADPNDAFELSPHAEWVASVLISTDTTDPDEDGDSPTGVAPASSLYSAGYNQNTLFVNNDQAASVTAQHQVNTSSNLRAINLSFGLLHTTGSLDGNQLFSLFLDWSARTHDILYVVAGNEDDIPETIPTDDSTE